MAYRSEEEEEDQVAEVAEQVSDENDLFDIVFSDSDVMDVETGPAEMVKLVPRQEVPAVSSGRRFLLITNFFI